MARWRDMNLACWGRHPVEPCAVARPEKRGDLDAALADHAVSSVLARGLGRSYGDAALNGNDPTDPGARGARRGVVLTERLNRFASFDAETGTLEAEAGLSLGRLIETSLPRGWFPFVTPGTRFVTLGGAVAADVHGKNHHAEGSFGNAVEGFSLITPRGERRWCSRDENAELFRATLGGMGLTGMIERVRLRLRPVKGGLIDVNRVRTSSLAETMRHLERMGSGGPDARTYSVAWLDCVKGGKAMGRGVVFGGEHSTQPGGETVRGSTKAVPFDLPGATLNRFSVAAFNRLYLWRNGTKTLAESWEPFFYPLDGVRSWNRIYGKGGFQQWQVVVPFGIGVDGVRELLDRIVRSKRASFLAVLKTMGERSEGLLGFARPGWTLALDFAQRPGLDALLGELDDAAIAMGGVRYLAKDASLTRERFEQMYPEAAAFREMRARLDPEQRVSSSLARRLGL